MNKHVTTTKAFVTIEGRVLAKALSLMSAIVERRASYPILAMVRLAVTGADLKVSGSDLDIEATTTLDAIASEGDWSVCVDPIVLARIAKYAGPAEVCIELVERVEGKVTDRVVVITAAEATYELYTLPADSFPTLQGARGERIETFGNGSFVAHLDKVAWCVSTEETRYYLNGVCWQMGPAGRRFIATDGHKMAVCRYDAEIRAEKLDRIIPRKTVSVLRRFAAGQDVSTYAVVKANQQGDLADDPIKLDLSFGSTTIRTKLIDGTYPDTDRVIPKPEAQKFTFGMTKPAITSALDRAMVMSSRTTSCAVRFFPDAGGGIAVEAKRADIGEAHIALPATLWPVNGSEAAEDFGMNAEYLSALLAKCEGDISFRMIDAGAPFVVSDGDDTMTRVIMPMRV